jgi:glycosyltransferase 2 family protein
MAHPIDGSDVGGSAASTSVLELSDLPDSPERPQHRLRRRTVVRLVRVAGLLVALAAVSFCVKTLVDDWSRIGSSVEHASPAWMTLALGCSALSMTGLGVLWWKCLAAFGDQRGLALSLSWYFGGELGKYVPGGIWPVVGRGELAARGGVRRGAGYATTLIAYGCMCAAAMVVCGVLAPIAASWGWALIALVPIALVAAHPAVLHRLLAVGWRLSRGRLSIEPLPWPGMLRLVAWSLPTWLLLGASSASIARALGEQQDVARVMFATVAAWAIGFLAVPVPAGVGLREVVFVALSGLPAAEATAVAAAARLVLVVVDAVGGVLGLSYAHKSHLVARSKSAYATGARGMGRALTKVGLLAREAPARERRLRHWAHSLTKLHDVRAMVDLDVPWWTYRAIDIVDAWLATRQRPIRVFEYGSGASTVWLARRADEVHSVEHDARFAEHLRPMLEAYPHVTLHVVEPVPSASPVVPSAKSGYARLDFSDYVSAIERVPCPFDLVVIDGRAREACLAPALSRLAPGGLIVYDNTRRPRYRRAIAAAGVTEQRFRGLTPALPYPDQTSMLRAS